MAVTHEKSPEHQKEQAAMTTGESATPALVLGPMLRYVGETEATIWVETDRECQVEILGRRARTFEVAGHHYALVILDGLVPGSEQAYQVALDGTVRWPTPGSDFPPSGLRTLMPGRPVRLAFGSCRAAEVSPRNLDRRTRRQRATQRAAGEQGEMRGAAGDPIGAEGTDALAALAAGLRDAARDNWPDLLLMIGDQVYADDPGPATRRFIADHRAGNHGPANDRTADDRAADAMPVPRATAASALDAAPPGEVADFAEYCALYREAWSEPAVRWLFSVVPTAMIFDDHEVRDDWNTSEAWRREIAARPWWPMRIQGAYQSYWVYQHLGNLSPDELDADEVWGKVREQGDAAAVLADLAHRADQRAPDIRWSFHRTFAATGGKVRVVVLDSRSRRVVDGKRLIADEEEWHWFTEAVRGDWEHLVLATSVPPLLPRGIHTLEAWDEKIRGGAWGRRAAGFGERLRQAVDLEHWPAFGESFYKLERLLVAVATGQCSPHGEPPASVTIISGDVHHSYLTAVSLPPSAPAATNSAAAPASVVYQAVCSPFHQAMPPKLRIAQRLASAKASGLIGTAVAALAGARVPGLRWRDTHGPWFGNMIATLNYDGTKAIIRFDEAVNDQDAPRLTPVLETDLT
jgi:PhoD-like phosphatase